MCLKGVMHESLLGGCTEPPPIRENAPKKDSRALKAQKQFSFSQKLTLSIPSRAMPKSVYQKLAIAKLMSSDPLCLRLIFSPHRIRSHGLMVL